MTSSYNRYDLQDKIGEVNKLLDYLAPTIATSAQDAVVYSTVSVSIKDEPDLNLKDCTISWNSPWVIFEEEKYCSRHVIPVWNILMYKTYKSTGEKKT